MTIQDLNSTAFIAAIEAQLQPLKDLEPVADLTLDYVEAARRALSKRYGPAYVQRHPEFLAAATAALVIIHRTQPVTPSQEASQ